MTKKRKSDPFSFKGFGNSGFKIPRSSDPFKVVRKTNQSFNFNNKSIIPKSIIPSYKPLKIDNTWGKMMKESQKEQERSWKEMKKSISQSDRRWNTNLQNINNIGISNNTKPFITKKNTTFIQSNSPLIPERPLYRNDRIIVKQNDNPTLMSTINDIITTIKKKHEEKERKERIIRERTQMNLKNAIKQQVIESITSPYLDTKYHSLKYLISNVNNKVDNNTKKTKELTDKVEKVSSLVDALAEKIAVKEEFKKTVEEGLEKIIKMQDVNENNEQFLTAINYLLKEIEKIDAEIKSLKAEQEKMNKKQDDTTLKQENIVERLEKGEKFDKTMHTLFDDKRFDPQV